MALGRGNKGTKVCSIESLKDLLPKQLLILHRFPRKLPGICGFSTGVYRFQGARSYQLEAQ